MRLINSPNRKALTRCPTGISAWLNGVLIAFEDIPADTTVNVPVPRDILLTGENTLELIPIGALDELTLAHFELSNGPISRFAVPEPASLGPPALGGLAVLRRKHKRRE